MVNPSVKFTNAGVAACPYSIALEYVSEYMARFKPGATEKVVLPFRSMGLPFGGGFRRNVALVFNVIEDRDDRSRSHEALNFGWDARTRYLPRLHGVLNFRIAGVSLTELLLTSEYNPPFGVIGRIFDSLLGRRISIATGQALLERIIHDMESRELVFRAAHAAEPMV